MPKLGTPRQNIVECKSPVGWKSEGQVVGWVAVSLKLCICTIHTKIAKQLNMAVWYFVFQHRYLRVYYCTTATVDSTVMQHRDKHFFTSFFFLLPAVVMAYVFNHFLEYCYFIIVNNHPVRPEPSKRMS
jgi:hypothetical protein